MCSDFAQHSLKQFDLLVKGAETLDSSLLMGDPFFSPTLHNLMREIWNDHSGDPCHGGRFCICLMLLVNCCILSPEFHKGLPLRQGTAARTSSEINSKKGNPDPLLFEITYAATSHPSNSTCSNTVSVAFSCLSGG